MYESTARDILEQLKRIADLIEKATKSKGGSYVVYSQYSGQTLGPYKYSEQFAPRACGNCESEDCRC